MKKNDSRRVYSTNAGRHCPNCQQPLSACRCAQARLIPTGDGIVHLHRQSKGRRGKPVTLIKGLALPAGELATLCSALKKHLGVGGSIDGDSVLIQGDHRARIAQWLEAREFVVRISGS